MMAEENTQQQEEHKGSQYVRVEIIAQFFGVTVRRVQQLTQEGIIKTTPTPEGNRYNLVETLKTYIQYLSDKAYGKSKSEKEAELREAKNMEAIEALVKKYNIHLTDKETEALKARTKELSDEELDQAAGGGADCWDFEGFQG